MSDDTTYQLVHSPSPGELTDEVSKRISEGWWPLGTPFVHGEHFIQAMVQEPTAAEPIEIMAAEG